MKKLFITITQIVCYWHNMDIHRKCVVSVLSKRFTEENAKSYERKIHDLSVKTKEDYITVSYEKVGQLLISSDIDVPSILADIDNQIMGWNSCIYTECKNKRELQYTKMLFKPVAVKGLHKCKDPKCGSDEFFVWNAQTRSADEGSTQYRQCARCGKRGKE